MMEFYIYTLTDPEDKIIKYVGKTKNLEKRLRTYVKLEYPSRTLDKKK